MILIHLTSIAGLPAESAEDVDIQVPPLLAPSAILAAGFPFPLTPGACPRYEYSPSAPGLYNKTRNEATWVRGESPRNNGSGAGLAAGVGARNSLTCYMPTHIIRLVSEP